MKAKTILWPIFIFFSLGVGLYPILYFVVDMTNNGLLALKGSTFTESPVWSFAFYTHIAAGGLSLITGWSQFSKRLRTKYLNLHRTLGKIYLLAVLMSGLTGCYIAVYASGGMIAKLGFGSLSILWLYTAWRAYSAIKNKQVPEHRNWMIRNYALSWAGVMLRLWLPLFQIGFGFKFLLAYKIIAWLCWIPNLFYAEFSIRSNQKREADLS